MVSRSAPHRVARPVQACVALSLLVGASAIAVPEKVFHRGVALGLFSTNAEHRYDADLDEIAAQGASHVSLVNVWYQRDIRADSIAPRDGYSPSMATLRRTIDAAHQRGLQVLLFPILGIERRARHEWRGRIEPGNWDAWFSSYRTYILRMTDVAAGHGVEVLSIGSELLSTETKRGRWLKLIAQIRARYRGKLLYSANWDHYAPVTFWDKVDLMGVTGYYELTRERQPSEQRLVEAWRRWRDPLVQYVHKTGLPLVFTEIGYPSLDGANIYPWDETRKEPVDVEEQALCLRAFIKAWQDEERLRGVYFWNWYGSGGLRDKGYTPRGKPATKVIRAWFATQSQKGSKEPE